MNSLSIVIPIYNEEAGIDDLFSEIYKVIPGIIKDFEIIAVDDASMDSTPLMLDKIALQDKRVSVVRNKDNRGLGGSLKEGLRHATKDLILYFDADLPFDLRDIKKALEILKSENADFVSAYRTNRGIDGFKRAVYSYVYNAMINILFRLGLRDINFSFKLFKKEILERVKLEAEGSFISAELLIKSKLEGFKIVQFPVKYYSRRKGRSMLSSLAVIFKIIREMVFFYANFFIQKRNNKIDVSQFFKNPSLLKKIYMFLRIKTCPFGIIEKHVYKKGKILDLGCGYGIFSILMHMKSNERQISAIDWSENRICFAKSAAGVNNVDFKVGDIMQAHLDSYDNIILIDVLYLLSCRQQKELLLKCYKALRPNGALIIKEMDDRPAYKHVWCFIQELIVTKLFKSNVSTGINYINREYLTNLLEGLGSKVETVKLDKGYLYPHILYTCKNE